MQSRHDGSAPGPGWLASEPVPTGRNQWREKRKAFRFVGCCCWPSLCSSAHRGLVLKSPKGPSMSLPLYNFQSSPETVGVLYMNILGVMQTEFFSYFILMFFELTFGSRPSKDHMEEWKLQKIVVLHLELMFYVFFCICFFIIKNTRQNSYLTFVCRRPSDYWQLIGEACKASHIPVLPLHGCHGMFQNCNKLKVASKCFS